MPDPVDPNSQASIASQNAANTATQAGTAATTDATNAQILYKKSTDDVTDSLTQYEAMLAKTTNDFAGHQAAVKDTIGILDTLESKYDSYVDTMENAISFNKQQSTELAALTTALVGTRTAMKDLQGVDTSRVNTYKGQWQQVTEAFKNGSLGATAMMAAAQSMAAGLGQTIPASKSAGNALFSFMDNMLTGADNTLRAANAMEQYSAKSGGLDNLLSRAGPHLEKMNELVAQQRAGWGDTADAVNLPMDQVEKYFGVMGSLPGIMSETVTASDGMMAKSTGSMSKNISVLTAGILTAVGSGRELSAVVDDMNVAFKNYGVVGESALKFSAQLSKISNDNKVSIDSVKTALGAVANEFGRFANAGDAAAKMSQGLAESIDQYSQALQNSGMSAENALKNAQGLVGAMGQMDVAQRALLSQQTGGPGGLMGAAQIEKLMRDDPKAALEKMRQMITKQMGPAVSVDEAAASPAAAARQAAQRAMLTQGPFKIASNDQDATRMLDAMAKIGTGQAKNVDFTKVLGDTMSTGQDIQSKSFTEVQKGITALNKIQAAVDSINANLIGENLGGEFGEGGPSERQQALLGTMQAGAAGSGEMSARAAAKPGTGTPHETANEQLASGFSGVYDRVRGLTTTAKEEIMAHTGSTVKKATDNKTNTPGTTDQRRSGLNDALSYTAPSFKVDDLGQALPPGQQLGAAARGTAGHLGRTTVGATPTGDPGTTGHRGAGTGDPIPINIHVTATCEHCGNALNNQTPQARAVTAVQRQ
jgi:hypothetical protein